MTSLVLMPYCPGSIGEQVVQVPFLRFLREVSGADPIVGLVPTESGGVIESLGLLDESIRMPVRGGPAEAAAAWSAVRRRRFDRVYHLRRKSLRLLLLARAATNAPVTGFEHGVNRSFQRESIPFDTQSYVAENYVRLLGRSLADFAAGSPRRPDGSVLVIPGGLTEVKRFPLESYAQVAERLAARGRVRFLLGPGAPAEREFLAGRGLETTLAPSMLEIETLVLGSSLVIANDCGPAHFAHIHDVPRLSLFDRSVDHEHWFWAGSRGHLCLSAGPGRLAEIRVDDVVTRAESILARA